jgi:hypothetical protein
MVLLREDGEKTSVGVDERTLVGRWYYELIADQVSIQSLVRIIGHTLFEILQLPFWKPPTSRRWNISFNLTFIPTRVQRAKRAGGIGSRFRVNLNEHRREVGVFRKWL